MPFLHKFTPSNPFGEKGETQAALYLEKTAGLKILKRHWRCPLGEVDLIGRDSKGTLVFVEVKTRSQNPEDGWEALHPAKRKRLHRLALSYLHTNGLPLETSVRFDVVIVGSEGVLHHEPDAFEAESEI